MQIVINYTEELLLILLILLYKIILFFSAYFYGILRIMQFPYSTKNTHFIADLYINFDVSECHANKLFCNKLWQATKFTKKWFQTVSETQHLPSIDVDEISIMDKWILSRLSKLVDTANRSLESHDFHVTVTALKDFLHHNFCDVYVVSK